VDVTFVALPMVLISFVLWLRASQGTHDARVGELNALRIFKDLDCKKPGAALFPLAVRLMPLAKLLTRSSANIAAALQRLQSCCKGSEAAAKIAATPDTVPTEVHRFKFKTAFSAFRHDDFSLSIPCRNVLEERMPHG